MWMCVHERVKKRCCVQSVSQQGCVISAGHTTHSWDARAVWRGHSSLAHTHQTPAVSALIKINLQLHIIPCELSGRKTKWLKQEEQPSRFSLSLMLVIWNRCFINQIFTCYISIQSLAASCETDGKNTNSANNALKAHRGWMNEY